jgi:hypothetical protein
MAKTARRPAPTAASPTADVPVVGQREPCPCGSGKKYKACHGRTAAIAAVVAPVARPFAGLPGEVDWVALREVVPAATATVRLRPEHQVPASGDVPAVEEVTIASVLPLAWPALRRADGAVFVGLQTGGGSGDASRDVAGALLRALATEPGSPVELAEIPGAPPLRLQDVVDTSAPLQVVVHEGFDFWVEGAPAMTDDVRASLEQANAAVVPTVRLTGVEGAYWCRIGERTHLRWVLPQDEDVLLDAIARLHAAGASSLGEGTRYIGAFRAHGLLVPVWDLAPGTEADAVEQPAADFAARLEQALAADAPLTYDERRARAGVVSRQVTLR